MNILLADILMHFKPAFFVTIALIIYSIFVLHFYKFLSQRDLFEIDLDKFNFENHAWLLKFREVIIYLLKYLIIFPIFTFLWLIFLTLVLIFLSVESINNILIIAISLLVTVRAAAYYNEDLAKDLAKMLPFSLLGAFIINFSNFSFLASLEKLNSLSLFWQSMLYYLLFALIFELVLKIIKKIKE